MLSDNGSPCKGVLITTFCRKLRIRIIHSAVRHPQTNAKLERAFMEYAGELLVRKMSGLLSGNGCRIMTVAHYTFYVERRHRCPTPAQDI
jgi:transposase InsO family protein